MTDKQRLPRTDIPPDFRCPYAACAFQAPESSKRREVSFRNHMSHEHGIYYESAYAETEVSKKLAKYERHADNLKEIEQLKPWHCLALARHVVYGQPYTEVAKEMKHSAQAISAVAQSPAGQAFIAKATAELRDPVKLVKDLMASDVFTKHMDWLQAWEWAMQAKDYEAIHKMAKDIGLQPALEQKQQQGPTKISLHLNVNDLATPPVTTSFRVIDAEVVEDTSADE